jgi:antitoxin component of MazEF toxin-antitoxin module
MNMKRKLIKQGVNALTLTLPAQWTEQFRLHAGDEVDVDVEGNVLIVRSLRFMKSGVVAVQLKESTMHYYREVLSTAYRRGFDEIHVRYEGVPLAAIQDILQELLGFEITSITAHSITIKSVVIPDLEQFDILYARTLFILKEAMSFLRADVRSGDFDEEKILNLQREQLKLCNFCRRSLHKLAFADMADTYARYAIIVHNDHLISQLKYVYAAAAKTRQFRHSRYLDEIVEFIELVINAILAKDAAKIEEIIKRKYALFRKKEEAITSAGKSEQVLLQEFAILVRLAGDYLSPLSLLTLKDQKK